MLPESLQNRRIAILGTGREGQAVYRWLKQQDSKLPLHCFAESPVEAGFLASIQAEDNVSVGAFDGELLGGFDILLRSPGISPYRKELMQAQASGVQIMSPSSLWFAANPQARTICVTGTKGKSTTSALIAHLLRACGQRVQLAGNIGKPLLDCDGTNIDWWVIELSSYQLCDLEARPNISVVLNLSPEHLDWHGGEQVYFRDKLRLAELSRTGALIINACDAVLKEQLLSHNRILYFNDKQGIHAEGKSLFDAEECLAVEIPECLPGKHSRSNIAAALTVIRTAGLELASAIVAVKGFEGLPHRLQKVGEKGGVSWINDSISTTPVSTVAALEALEGKSVILLIGGFDRGLDWSRHLPGFLDPVPKALIALPDSGKAAMQVLISLGLRCPAGEHVVYSLEEGVELARKLAETGDTVLLSPGAPSFPRFRDFQHRGEEFVRLAGFKEAGTAACV